MRWRVDDGLGGYASFDDSEKEKAWEYYESIKEDSHRSGVRIRSCHNLFDEGIVVVGPPIVEDLSINKKDVN